MRHIFIILIGMLLFIPNDAKAQGLFDWFTDPIGAAGAYIENQIYDAISSEAHNMWEGFLNDDIQSSLSNDAKRIVEYVIDSTYLASTDSLYPQWSNQKQSLRVIDTRLSSIPEQYYRFFKSGSIEKYGHGIVGNLLHQQSDSVVKSHEIYDFTQILAKESIDSLKSLCLLQDSSLLFSLKKNPMLVQTFNLAPELINLNNKWRNTFLYCNASQLYYWGKKANIDDNKLPKKAKLPLGTSLKMDVQELNSVSIYKKEGLRLGLMSKEKSIHVDQIDLINLRPMPNATYVVDNITYSTDEQGRVSFVSQPVGIEQKGKTAIKGKIKGKDFMQVLGAPASAKPYFLALKKYHGSDSRINIVPLHASPENKKVVALINKKIKSILKTKSSVPIKSHLIYNASEQLYPTQIVVKIENEEFTLENHSL